MTWRAGLLPAGALLAVASLLTSTPTLTALAAPAVERPALGDGALTIRIARLAPAIPEPGDQLTVVGTITNSSDAPVSDVSAVLRVSPTPLVNRDEIPEVLAGAGQRLGETIVGTDEAVADELAPGQSRPFEVRADVADLGLGGVGVYVTGVEARGDSGAGAVRQDMDRTFLPWWPRDTAVEPLLLTTLWPLSGAPLRDD